MSQRGVVRRMCPLDPDVEGVDAEAGYAHPGCNCEECVKVRGFHGRVDVSPPIDVLADLERRIVALEDAGLTGSVVRRVDEEVDKKVRELVGMLTDVAAPARRVIAFVDGAQEKKASLEHEFVNAYERGQRDQRETFSRMLLSLIESDKAPEDMRRASRVILQSWIENDA